MTDHNPHWTILVYISGDDVLDNFAIESLKQLREGASDHVTVEIRFDPNLKNESLRDGHYDGTPNACLFKKPANEKTVSQKGAPRTGLQENLQNFINEVPHLPTSLTGADAPNRRYGLVLWGHGPELLLDADQPSKDNVGGGPGKNYFTPATLRDALAKSNKKFDFIAMDACSMSIVEVAAELQEYVDFMIASQDDVPDQSFPYQKILEMLKETSDAKEACKQIAKEYKDAFQDYISDPDLPVTNITLSSLNLKNIGEFTGLLGELTTELKKLDFASEKVRKALIHARSESRDFVLGLYVDIFDFCQNLQEEQNVSEDLKSVCKKICPALTVRSQEGDLVLANQTIEKGDVQCHGLSIYLPYLTAEKSKKLEESLTMTIGGTGIATQLSKGGLINLHKSRAARIAETEQDLASLGRFNEQTGWSDFIKCTWSYILAEDGPMELDVHYSAQQCVLNILSCKASGTKRPRKVGSPRLVGGRGKNKRPSIRGKRAA